MRNPPNDVNADVWMGPDEDVARAACGCTLARDFMGSGDPAINYCVLHAAAGDLLNACRVAFDLLGKVSMWRVSNLRLDVLRSAIQKAEGFTERR